MRAMFLLRVPLEAYLQLPDPDRWPPPACIISDTLHYWTADVAHSLSVPRLSFHGPSCFYITCSHLIKRHKAELDIAAAGEEPFLIPGLPQPIQTTMKKAAPIQSTESARSKILEDIRAAEAVTDGVVVNTFEELEHWYLDSYREETGKPVWPVGPLSLYKETAEAKAARGRASSVEMDALLRWLDDREAGSVVLVSFGSVVRRSLAQLVEIGHGLEDSARPFVWAVKEARDRDEVARWAAEMQDRIGDKGLIIKGWLPQVTILSHAAVGGFVTHCGWNSTLEAVAAGVPMATWPHAYDQFMNERLAVDVLRVGVEVGAREPVAAVVEEDTREETNVTREQVRKAVERLFDTGAQGEDMRQRATELAEKARSAMEEGGSSSQNLDNIIRYVNQSNNNI
ncbi:hypothetical protein HPP92_025822 [Vanilla planifolia]|uniref:Glycosyltransferase n=1 Tax=Vanilla planifolia TaxID=51239 RepID=A0A835U9E4_VANPL|nr:hypothetical protein HPP92_025822 [Vanilla planifolia]